LENLNNEIGSNNNTHIVNNIFENKFNNIAENVDNFKIESYSNVIINTEKLEVGKFRSFLVLRGEKNVEKIKPKPEILKKNKEWIKEKKKSYSQIQNFDTDNKNLNIIIENSYDITSNNNNNNVNNNSNADNNIINVNLNHNINIELKSFLTLPRFSNFTTFVQIVLTSASKGLPLDKAEILLPTKKDFFCFYNSTILKNKINKKNDDNQKINFNDKNNNNIMNINKIIEKDKNKNFNKIWCGVKLESKTNKNNNNKIKVFEDSNDDVSWFEDENKINIANSNNVNYNNIKSFNDNINNNYNNNNNNFNTIDDTNKVTTNTNAVKEDNKAINNKIQSVQYENRIVIGFLTSGQKPHLNNNNNVAIGVCDSAHLSYLFYTVFQHNFNIHKNTIKVLEKNEKEVKKVEIESQEKKQDEENFFCEPYFVLFKNPHSNWLRPAFIRLIA
jgi:hypothetical protein